MMFIAPSANLPFPIPQRLPGLQRVLDALLRLPLGDETEERFALEVQQPLLGHGRRVRDVSSGHDRGELPADRAHRDR